MNKTDLATCVSKKSGLSKKDSEKAISAFTDCVVNSLSKGERIQLIGFGTFDIRHRAERQGRNPLTGKSMTIKASTLPVFKPGKGFKECVSKGCKAYR